MSVLYQCDKCKKTFPKATDVINLRGTDDGAGIELQADLCDGCFASLMNVVNPCGPAGTQPEELHFEVEDDEDSFSFYAGGRPVEPPSLPANKPLRTKHTQLDLTGIAPEDRTNQTE